LVEKRKTGVGWRRLVVRSERRYLWRRGQRRVRISGKGEVRALNFKEKRESLKWRRELQECGDSLM